MSKTVTNIVGDHQWQK